MRIVVLDALPLDADGDMDWSPLRALGDLTLYAQTAPEETAARIADADAVFTNKVRLDAAHFDVAPHLRLVSVLATGHDIVNGAAARDRGITVCNVPGYSTPSTAQTTIALLLELCHHVGDHARRVREGAWTDAGRWSYWETTPVELAGLRLLLVGKGAIGTQVGRVATALGMTVQAAQLPGRDPEPDAAIPYVPLETGLADADVISLHCPLTPDTRHLINRDRLARMKPGTFLINTARGGLIDEEAVVESLWAGHLGGYAADVLGVEPPPRDHPLLSAPRCLITAHYAWASRASRARLLTESIENLRAFLAGTPRNVVNGAS